MRKKVTRVKRQGVLRQGLRSPEVPEEGLRLLVVGEAFQGEEWGEPGSQVAEAGA